LAPLITGALVIVHAVPSLGNAPLESLPGTVITADVMLCPVALVFVIVYTYELPNVIFESVLICGVVFAATLDGDPYVPTCENPDVADVAATVKANEVDLDQPLPLPPCAYTVLVIDPALLGVVIGALNENVEPGESAYCSCEAVHPLPPAPLYSGSDRVVVDVGLLSGPLALEYCAVHTPNQ
jgi:hypothetical protein